MLTETAAKALASRALCIACSFLLNVRILNAASALDVSCLMVHINLRGRIGNAVPFINRDRCSPVSCQLHPTQLLFCQLKSVYICL